MHNSNDSFGSSGSGSGLVERRRSSGFKVNLLSACERDYLLGLFLTDGYCRTRVRRDGNRRFEVYFYLQGDEGELAKRIAGLLRKTGLNPHAMRHSHKRMFVVMIDSKDLVEFLPDKRGFMEDAKGALLEKFLVDSGFFDVDAGIPFLAGVLDGDGSCPVSVEKGVCCFGAIKPWNWGLEQSKLPFLAEYVGRFVESLVAGSVWKRVSRRKGKRDSVQLRIRKPGILALLGAGIEKYSWKATRWSAVLDEVRRERGRFLTTGQVARMLGVSCGIVVGWLRSGKMKFVRRGGVRTKRSLSHYYILAEEVESFKVAFLKKEEETVRIMRDGVRLVDLATMLGIPRHTLLSMHQRGKLQATLVRERGKQGKSRHLVIPKAELERLRRELKKEGGD